MTITIMKRNILLTAFILVCNIAMPQWVDLNTGIPSNLNAAYFTTNSGWVVGESAIYNTIDGGSTWTEHFVFNNFTDSIIMESSVFNDIYIYNGDWYAIGQDTISGDGVIFRYPSTTSLWELSHSVPNTKFNGIFSGSGSEIVVVGDSGIIEYTPDFGNTWINSPTGVTNNLKCIHSGLITYVGGDSINLYSTNIISSGWTYGGSQGMEEVYVKFNNSLYTVNELMIRYKTGSFWWENNNFTGLLEGTSISFKNQTEAYVGTKNGILRSYDNLDYWERMPSADGYVINDVFTLYNSSDAYAVGPNGLVLKTTNNGGNSTPVVLYEITGGCVDSLVNFINQGPNSYSYTWKINSIPFSNNMNEDSIFNTPTTYNAMLIASNGMLTDSVQAPFNVVVTPDTTLSISVSDTILCKMGNSDITIHSSQINIEYSLIRFFDNSTVGTVTGTGANIMLSTGNISDSTKYIIKARHVLADCEIYMPDTILIAVEHTKAKFHPHLINADLNEAIHFYNNSEQASSYLWTFGSGSSTPSSTLIEPDISYNQLGQTQTTLIATSLYGCKDTTTTNGAFIYDSQSVSDNCWAQKTSEYERAYCVKATNDNGVLVAGEYAKGIFPSKIGNTSNQYDEIGFYLVKYDENGVLKWMVRSKRWHTNTHFIDDIETDSDGNIYVTGTAGRNNWLYSNNGDSIFIDFPNFPNTTGFIIKFDSNGVYQWISKIGYNSGVNIGIDGSNNIYVSGNGSVHYSSDGTLFPQPAPPTHYRATNFLLKMDSAGIINWVTYVGNGTLGQNFLNVINDLAVDSSGNIVIVGYHQTSGVFTSVNIPDVIIPQISSSSHKAYIVKYNTNGDVEWANPIYSLNTIGQSRDFGEGVVVDRNGNSYVVFDVEASNPGEYVNFPSISSGVNQVSAGSYVIASYDKYGDFRWGTGSRLTYGGGHKIAIDNQNNLYTLSRPWNNSATTVDFLSTDTVKKTLPLNNGSFYLSKYNSDGNLKWVTMESGLTSNNLGTVYPFGLSTNNKNDVYVVGSLNASNYLIASDSLTTGGIGVNGNAFFAKFSSSACLQSDSIQIVPPTGPYCFGDTVTFPFNVSSGVTILSSNIYELQLSDSLGSFSSPQVIGTLNSINNIDTITGTIPNIFLSGNYYLRVVASQPNIIGNSYSVNLSIKPSDFFGSYQLCQGNLLQLQSNNGISYNWQPSTELSDSTIQSPVTTTTNSIIYSVEVNTQCGLVNDTFNITVNSLPTVSLARFNPDTLCDNASAVTLPTGSPSGGIYIGSGIVGGNFNPSTAGAGTHNIIYTYTDSNSCINSDTTIITVDICTGLNLSSTDFGIIIYPNPGTGQFTIEKPNDLNKEVQIKLLDATSKLILEKVIPMGKQKVKMDIRNHSKGIYHLHLIIDDEQFVKQILKN
ncbi:MAG: hypothetical protein COB15_16775 [Flavobacteriales bacterium]|nr:MAG: hypothetical protein COB15_16775 [Flavobacteriales bacterium]